MPTRTIRVQVTSTAVPSWFANQTDKTWIAFTGGTDAIEAEAGYRPGGFMSYSSGDVHTGRQSLLLVGAGHTFGDNGVYEFPILDTSGPSGTPRWKLYKAKTTPRYPAYAAALDWSIDAVKWNPDNYWERYAVDDTLAGWVAGGPSAFHSYNTVAYAPDTQRLMITAQSGMFAGPENIPIGWGTSTPNRYGVWSLDDASRTWTPLQRDTHYTTSASIYAGFSSAVWTDEHPSLGPHILRLKSGSTTDSWPFMTDTTTGARTRLTTFANGTRIAAAFNAAGPIAVATGLGFIGALDIESRTFIVVNARDYTDARNNDARNVTSWPTGSWSINHGMVWHGPSRAFLLWGATGSATPNLWKLAPTGTPVTLEDWLTTAWTATEITPAAANAVIPTAPRTGAQTYKRFNIIRDVAGSGYDALVLINDYAGPTFVYKLPQGGL